METSSSKTLWYIIGGIIVLVLAVFGLNKLASQDSQYTVHDNNPAQDTKFKGPADAPVTLIEYSDFQCPACANVTPLIKQLHETFPDQLKIAYRYFPLTRIHPNAFVSARAAEAAHRQGKFWEMHDILFTRQKDWERQNDPLETFRSYATEIGLNIDQFNEDLNDSSIGDAVKQDQALGTKANIPGTPTFFLNGERISPSTPEEFKQLIQDAIDKTQAEKSK